MKIDIITTEDELFINGLNTYFTLQKDYFELLYFCFIKKIKELALESNKKNMDEFVLLI